MPLRESVQKQDKFICSILLLLGFVFGILGVFTSEHSNIMIGACVLCLLLLCLAIYTIRRRRCNECTVYTRGVVTKIWSMHSTTHLLLRYSVYGQGIDGEVTYHEPYCPAMGETVGLYYAESHPSYCMLKVYKENKPGWSKVTAKRYRDSIVGLLPLAVLFLGIGVGLLAAVAIKYPTYTHSAVGSIIAYEEHRTSLANVDHAMVRTAEFIPVIQYEVDGVEQVAKSVQVQLEKTYEVGSTVTVRYNPSTPNTVVIVGDYTSATGAILLLAFGLFLVGIAIKRVVCRKRVLSTLVYSIEDIQFL